MQKFTSPDQVPAADLPANQALLVEEILDQLIAAATRKGRPYDPEEHGYVVLVEKGDEQQLRELLGCEPAKAPYERVKLLHGCFVTAVVCDQFGISLVIPDAPWLDAGLRLPLESALEMEAATSGS